EHRPHRRLVVRAGDHDRRVAEHQGRHDRERGERSPHWSLTTRTQRLPRSQRASSPQRTQRTPRPFLQGINISASSASSAQTSSASSATSASSSFFYSVINGSNVHNASVTKTTSKKPSSVSHIVAVGSSGGADSSAVVPRTPAIITGTVMGYNRIGSSTSRV